MNSAPAVAAPAEDAGQWDAGQRAVVTAEPDVSGVVIGGPGTGKTAALVGRVAHLLGAGGLTAEEVLVLTPSRADATRLRDRIGVRIAQATPGPLARSLGSFAFQLVRGAMVHAGEDPPALLTGADQDLILADLLAGDIEDGMREWPEGLGPAVRASTAFRSELRAFLAESTELGVSLEELASSSREPWRAAAGFLQEYRRAMAGMRAAHRDVPELLAEAAGILRTAAPGALGPLAELRAVLIDDAQELTRGGVRLVRALRERGVAVLAFGDPDISSGAFRGASPQLFAELAGVLGDVHVLDVAHRQHPALAALTRTVTQAIGVAGRVEHRRAPDDDAGIGGVIAILASAPHAEADRIAGVLREWHLREGVPWHEMAVIAHDTRQIASLEAELAAREVPTRAAGVQRPLGSEPIVRDIVGIVRLGLQDADEREVERLAEALTSPFGGLDAVGLRRLRARLRHHELEGGGRLPARELLRQAMAEPAHLLLIDAPEARVAHRFAETLAQVHRAGRAGETVHELLWRVWDRARALGGASLQNAWKEAAAQPGGAEIARSLDSLVALFATAKRSVERAPHEGPGRFIRDILDSEVPEDALTAPERPGRVTLMTPATALGAEFEAVVIAGVQDGIWPNVRLRGGMLDTWRLADTVLAAREGRVAEEPAVIDRRRAALHDELRLFVRALSRARSRLAVTAVSDDDHVPSPFLSFLPPSADTAEEEERYAHPFTLRGLVARHRRTLTASQDAAARAHAAGQLRLLAEAGVPGAAPDQWYGIVPASTDAPLRDLGAESVGVSPSAIEGFEECGLNWAIAALGGDTTRPPAAGIGTIVHEAMEKAPEGDPGTMAAVLDERWPELDFEADWIGRKERARAELFIARLQSYLREVGRDGGRVVGAEAGFRFAVDLADPDDPVVRPLDEEERAGLALLSGTIDRVEVYPPDAGEHAEARGRDWMGMAEGAGGERVVVVDLKTGMSDPETEAGVRDHAQLAAYQIAVAQGLIAGASPAALVGARLVIVSKTVGKAEYRVAHQHVLTETERGDFLRRVAEAAHGMAAGSFTAQVEAHCSDTQRRVSICRIHTIPAVSA